MLCLYVVKYSPLNLWEENHIYFLHFTEDYILYQLEMSTFPTALPRLFHRVLLPDGSKDYRL